MGSIRPAPFQLVGLTKLLKGSLHSLLIADGVGVGKTISAGYIASWTVFRLGGDVLVVCPTGLTEKWRLELKQKFDIKARLIRNSEELNTARSERKPASPKGVYILPSSRLGMLKEFPCSTLIVDEIHNFRNSETQGWKALRRLATRCEYRVGLSATPINNTIEDLGAQYSILLPQYSPLAVQAAISDIWLSQAYELLAPILTRFTKERLGIHFARRESVDIRIKYSSDYARGVRRVVESVLGRVLGMDKYPLEAVTFFREAASSPQSFNASTGAKIVVSPDPKVEALRRFLRTRGRRALVFCQFTETVEYLSNELPEFRIHVMTGKTPVADREIVIDAFRQDPVSILLLTQVGSEGLDFQFCDTAVNYDLHWNPMILEQRAGRVDRIGQEKPVITIMSIRVDGSIDDRVWETVQRKLGIIHGSPLSPQTPRGRAEPLFDNPSILAEESLANRTVESLELSNRLRVDDVRVANIIGVEGCDPGVLVKMPEFGWLNQGSKDWLSWLHGFELNERDVTERLSRYQSVT